MTNPNWIPDSPLSGGPKVVMPMTTDDQKQLAAIERQRTVFNREAAPSEICSAGTTEELAAANLLLKLLATGAATLDAPWIKFNGVSHDMANAPSWAALVKVMGGIAVCRAAIAEREGE